MPSNVDIKVIADVTKAVRDLNKVGNAADTQATKLEGFSTRGAAAFRTFAAAGGVYLAGQAIRSLANTAVEVDLLNARVDTVFPTMAGTIRTWADDVNESMGLSVTQVAGMAASTGDLLGPFGFAEEKAADLAMKVAELGGALALYSPDVDSAKDATNILNKALLGERDGLIALNVKVSQAQVDAQKLADKEAGLTFKTDAAATAAATLTLITGQSGKAMAFAASDAADNALKVNELKAKWEDLQEKLSVAVLPVLEGVLDVLLFTANTGIPAVGTALEFILVKINPFVIAVNKITDAVNLMVDAFEKIPSLPSLPSLPGKGLIPNFGSSGVTYEDAFLPRGRSGIVGDFGKGTLAMLHGQEAVVPLDQMGGNMGNTIVINQTVQPGADPAEAGRMIVEALDAYGRNNGN